MGFLYLFLGVLIGVIAIYIILKPKLKATQVLDQETSEKNECLRNELLELTKEHSSLKSKREEILNNLNDLQQQATNLQNQASILQQQNITLQKQAEESSNALYEKSYELASEKMSQAAESMSQKFQQAQETAEQEYLQTLQECADSFQKQISNKKLELFKVNAELADLTAKLNAAVEANKRAEELKAKQDFYRLQLPQVDIDEISRLREVIPYLRDSEPLNKVIWKVYYEKPYTDLIGRVIGNGTHTGIYKITNIENQMCYVGQAANLADRWKQHIKRGIGAETPTRNKLYPAMLEYGVENFTFEVVEECDRMKLNDREDYWQEYFHAKDFGYSIK